MQRETKPECRTEELAGRVVSEAAGGKTYTCDRPTGGASSRQIPPGSFCFRSAFSSSFLRFFAPHSSDRSVLCFQVVKIGAGFDHRANSQAKHPPDELSSVSPCSVLLPRAIVRRNLANFQGPEIWRLASKAIGDIGQDYATIHCR